VDRAIVGPEQLGGESECVAHAHSNLNMEVSREGEVEQSRVWDPSGDTSPCGNDVRDIVMRQQVVDPLLRCADRKCCHRNVIESQVIILSIKDIYQSSERLQFL
jgi:hypothetical protein